MPSAFTVWVANTRLFVWMTTTPAFAWVIRHIASPLDPWVFKVTNGRFTSLGPPSMPMLTLTTTGRNSGRPRSVHLACLEHQGDYLIVASAMGQARHPGWRYNLEANPEVEVQVPGARFPARARMLPDREKDEIWTEILEAIPQMNTYEKRTSRNIRVFRL